MSDLRPGFLPVNDYLKLPRNRETWLLEPLIPTSGAALLYSPPKQGKSYMGIQLALSLTGQAQDWLGFPVRQTGKVLYLQLDTPRSTWAKRFEDMLSQGGLKYDEKLLLADRESVEHFPFDIIQPQHMSYLRGIVAEHSPVAVIVDTLRESHSGDEDNSTIARNVIANLVGATSPAALIIISHSRKAQPDTDRDMMDDHRGSSYITGRMDAILRLTKTRLYYAGRSIEEGSVRVERMDNGLWKPTVDEESIHLMRILQDSSIPSMRQKAKLLAPLVHKSEEACMSWIRRTIANIPKEGMTGASVQTLLKGNDHSS